MPMAVWETVRSGMGATGGSHLINSPNMSNQKDGVLVTHLQRKQTRQKKKEIFPEKQRYT